MVKLPQTSLEPPTADSWVNVVAMLQRVDKSASWGKTAFLNLSEKVRTSAS